MASCKEVSLLCLVVILVLIQSVKGYTSIPNFDEDSSRLNQPSRHIRNQLNSIPGNVYNEALDFAKTSIQQDDNFEENILGADVTLSDPNSAAFKYFLEIQPNVQSRNIDNSAEIVTKSSKYFVNKYCFPRQIDSESCIQYLSGRQLPERSQIRDSCEKTDVGSFDRLLPAKYADGVHEMAEDLPLPRSLTRQIDHSHRANHAYSDLNLLVLQWAQFIEYDLSRPVAVTKNNGDPVNCCTSEGFTLQPRKRHPSCAPLLGDEPNDGVHFKTCQNYVRHAKTFNKDCTFGSAVMLNQENGELDLSPLYGVPNNEGHNRLLAQSQLMAPTPPPTDVLAKLCANNGQCQVIGDWRVNSNPLISQLTRIFIKSHKDFARTLQSSVHNEQLFNLAKLKNIDKYLEIIYNWWLPTILGEDMAKMIINSRPNSNNSGKVSSEFGVAAIRFYLSMMPDMMPMKNSCMDGTLELSQHMYTLDFWNEENCNESVLLESMLSTNAHKVDLYYNPIVLDNWLKPKNGSGGLNGLALDIQKGRDHGLASYTKYLAKCSNKRISGWADLEEFIEAKELRTLQTMYETIDDIDLLIGGMAEKPANGLLGTTFSCILADQFSKLWHSLSSKPKIQMLSGTAAAKFLCDATAVKTVPQNIFKVVSERNPLLKCATLMS